MNVLSDVSHFIFLETPVANDPIRVPFLMKNGWSLNCVITGVCAALESVCQRQEKLCARFVRMQQHVHEY